MQVYRGMDIGTAKPPLASGASRTTASTSSSPGEPFSAALFQRDARAAIDDIARARRGCPIVAGGTGLYVRAALDDMAFPAGEQADNPTRERYERSPTSDGRRGAPRAARGARPRVGGR